MISWLGQVEEQGLALVSAALNTCPSRSGEIGAARDAFLAELDGGVSPNTALYGLRNTILGVCPDIGGGIDIAQETTIEAAAPVICAPGFYRDPKTNLCFKKSGAVPEPTTAQKSKPSLLWPLVVIGAGVGLFYAVVR